MANGTEDLGIQINRQCMMIESSEQHSKHHVPQFFVIDHSIFKIGDHHLTYAKAILEQVERCGYQPILATHMQFPNRDLVPPNWHVHSVFPFTTYSFFAVDFQYFTYNSPFILRLLGLLNRHPMDPFRPDVRCGNYLTRACRWIYGGVAKIWVNRFVRACEDLFERHPPQPHDHIFLPTVSEFDVVGVVELMKRHDWTRRVTWHMQFHFPFLTSPNLDREVESKKLAAMKRHFEGLLQRVPKHQIRWYCTNCTLADQFNRTETADFEWLPYPISVPAHRPLRQRSNSRPLRVLCALSWRREQGADQIHNLVRQIAKGLLATGRIELHVPVAKPMKFTSLSSAAAEAIVQLPINVPEDEYWDRLFRADIGLFLYNSGRYYARFSGIQGEMHCAGVPIILPSGLTNTIPNQHTSSGLPSVFPGLIARNQNQFGELLNEMVENYDVYHQAAREYATRYSQIHCTERAVDQLCRGQ